jgi:hypothetical protein
MHCAENLSECGLSARGGCRENQQATCHPTTEQTSARSDTAAQADGERRIAHLRNLSGKTGKRWYLGGYKLFSFQMYRLQSRARSVFQKKFTMTLRTG